MRWFLAFGLCVLTACTPRPELPVMGQVPEFQLTSQDGKPFDGKSLLGHVWISDFVFTHCPGPCLRMSSLMSRLQQSPPDIKLISFTVDPERDTPAALTAFAAKYNPQPGRWFFLTGSRDTLQTLSRDTFKLGDVDGSMNHSTRFVLVDKKGRVRGVYGTQEGDPVGRVRSDAIYLDSHDT